MECCVKPCNLILWSLFNVEPYGFISYVHVIMVCFLMRKSSDDTGKIARSAGVVSVAVMCSRVLGLVREQAFAILFGASDAFDAFVVAFRVPNMLRDLFGEGALSAAFVAVFTDYDTKKGERATWELAGNVLVFLGIVLSFVTLLGIIFSEQVVRLLVEADFEAVSGKVELTRLLTVIMFPFLIFISFSSVVMGILNTKGRFFVPAMASSFFNVGSIVGGVSLALVMPNYGQPPIVGMAIGTLIGGLLQLLCQLPTLFCVGFQFLPRLNLSDPGLKRILKLMGPALIGLAPLQVNVLVNTYFVSSLGTGGLSWLSYSFRLFWLPVGLFGVAISIATMPVISRYASLKDFDKLKETFVSSLTMAFCLTIPATVGLMLLGESITRVIFEHGAFDAFATIKTAEALSFFAIGLFAYSSVKIMVPVFYALDDTKYPVIGSFVTMGINFCLMMLTINLLAHRAPGFSTSCAMIVNFLFLITVLYKKLGGYSLSYLFTGLGKALVGTAIMAGWLFAFERMAPLDSGDALFRQITLLLLAILSSAGVYGAALYFLRVDELRTIIDRVKGRLAL